MCIFPRFDSRFANHGYQKASTASIPSLSGYVERHGKFRKQHTLLTDHLPKVLQTDTEGKSLESLCQDAGQ